MGDYNAFKQFQNILALKQLMTKQEFSRPLAMAQLGQHLSSGLASRASAAHSLFPIMRESGITSLPPGLEDLSSLVSPAVSEAHGRVLGTFRNKGRLDESLIGRRDVLNKSTEALTHGRELQAQREPLIRAELESRTSRNRASANMMSVYADLRQKGYEDNQIVEAMRFAVSRAGDQYQRAVQDREMNPKSGAQLPTAPTLDDLYQAADEYLASKKGATNLRRLGFGSSPGGGGGGAPSAMDLASLPSQIRSNSGPQPVAGASSGAGDLGSLDLRSLLFPDQSGSGQDQVDQGDPFADPSLQPDQLDEGTQWDFQAPDYSVPGIGAGSFNNYQGPPSAQTLQAMKLKQLLDSLNLGGGR